MLANSNTCHIQHAEQQCTCSSTSKQAQLLSRPRKAVRGWVSATATAAVAKPHLGICRRAKLHATSKEDTPATAGSETAAGQPQGTAAAAASDQQVATHLASQQQQQQALAQQLWQQQLQQIQRARYQVPWNIWDFVGVTAAVWVVNMSIPYAVLNAAAQLQNTDIQHLPLAEKEVLDVLCQLAQLASTFLIITSSTRNHQPLPKPWFQLEAGITPVCQALSTAIAAVGSGLLLSGFMTGEVNGTEEWRHLAGEQADTSGIVALLTGAVVLAPLTEELYFRGYVLPSLTKWAHPVLAVPLTGLLFASAHPSDAFLPEALLGCILGLSLFAADGNLLVPMAAHSLYNTVVLAAEFTVP